MDKNLTKVNTNPVRIMMVGRQEWEEMKKLLDGPRRLESGVQRGDEGVRKRGERLTAQPFPGLVRSVSFYSSPA